MRDATLATLAYADIFDFPLTAEELTRWAIIKGISFRTRGLQQKGGFFFLRGRSRLVSVRMSRKQEQERKWRIARRAARRLAFIPTIQLVGVTGGLAMNNAQASDDIDIFIITSSGTIWISRLLAVLCMDAVGLRRKPVARDIANKICLNMFVSEEGMGVPTHEADCFSAHEVLQMQPLWEKAGTYKKFLRANRWVRSYLPHAWIAALRTRVPAVHRTPLPVLVIFRLLEFPAKHIQLWYMKRRRTNEVISDTMLRFHPKDARQWVKRKLSARLSCYKIPLDKIFYAR